MNTKYRIVIQPGNPLDLKAKQLSPLFKAIQKSDPECEVEYSVKEQRGFGVTWWEVLYVWVPWGVISSAIAKKIVEVLADWAHRRIKGERKGSRPRSVTIYGPDGKVLKKIEVGRFDKEK